MRITIGIIIGLLFTINLYAEDILVKGGFIMHTGNVLEPGITFTENLSEPTNPSVNDEWLNPRTGIVKFYDGAKWKVKKTDSNMIKIDKDFDTEINQITDTHTKKALQLINKKINKTYKGEE
jgi:hypothetical protein